MITEAVWLASIVAGTTLVTSTIGPLILNIVIARTTRANKIIDWARQDKVAAQAAEAAKLLLERQELIAAKAAEAAKLLLGSNERVAASAKVTEEKLDAIHSLNESTHLLVNSKMSAVLQSLRTALREILSLKKERGDPPDPDTMRDIEELDKRIAEIDILTKNGKK